MFLAITATILLTAANPVDSLNETHLLFSDIESSELGTAFEEDREHKILESDEIVLDDSILGDEDLELIELAN